MKHLPLMLMLGMLSLSSQAVDTPIWNTKAKHVALQVADGDYMLGQRLKINAAFTGFAFAMPTYMTKGSSGKLSVYRWQDTFESTVGTQPLHAKTFTDCRDNAVNWVTFPELPAGEYLFTISEAHGPLGCWCAEGPSVSGGLIYAIGLGKPGDLQLTIRFSAKSDKPFGVCTPDAINVPPAPQAAPLKPAVDVMPDTWAFTDGLGRRSLGFEDVGAPHPDKTIALFYWTWHVSQGKIPPSNNQLIMDKHPEAIHDFNSEVWRHGVANFWNEPIYGYYITNDSWVLRRQAELLANAGVDAIFADNTNATMTWKDSYDPLFKTWLDSIKGGVNAPKVSFMLPFGPYSNSRQQIEALYMDIYRPQKYHPLWFYWDDKPMLMAHPDNLRAEDPLEAGLRSYFTYRRDYPGYVNPNPQFASWGWLSITPQAVYYADQKSKDANQPEQTTVGVAHNHDYKLHGLAAMNGHDIMGRSYTTKGYHREPDASKYGYNFAEQFDYALKVNPRVIFITGWNEWIAGRYKEWPEGHKTSVPNAFPDEFIDEYSRDIEPSKGELQDHYYYQFVNYVRRYKGVRPVPRPSAPKAIDLQGSFSQWDDVQPYFAAYRGNTQHRDAKGYATCHYTEHSGRNDIVGAKVARDDAYFHFLVECSENITPHTDNLWMTLYLDCKDGNAGWNSYDYVVNKTPSTATHAILERFTGAGYASEKVMDVPYRVEGRYMMLSIPRTAIDVSSSALKFTWTDNVHDATDEGSQLPDGSWQYKSFTGNILDFYVSGDVAPGGRFRFQYMLK